MGQNVIMKLALPDEVSGIVINTKPEITKKLITEAEEKGIKNIWFNKDQLIKKQF